MNQSQQQGEMASQSSIARESFKKLFSPDECAVSGCDRRPRQGSRFCGCHLEDRREGRVAVFHGTEEISPIGERNTWMMEATPYLRKGDAANEQ